MTPTKNSPDKLIAFHFLSLAQGGVERMRLVLAEEFLARGWRVDLVVCSDHGELAAQVPAGARVISLNAPRSLKSVVPLTRYLKREKPDALISSLGHQNISALLAKKLARSGSWLAVTQHNALGAESNALSLQHKLLPFAYRILLPLADKVIAVSEGVADDLARRTKYDRSKIAVIYNPAKPKKGIVHSADIKHRASKESDARLPTFVATGRLAPQKGFDVLLDALVLVRQTRNCQLTIYGVGPDAETLQKHADHLGLAEHVNFAGFVSDPQQAIHDADVFVLSSRYEGFGNVLVEALAVGLTIVSTDCDFGPSEILQNGKYGYLVPVNNPEELARRMLYALDNRLDPQSQIQRASLFSIEAAVDRYLSLINTGKV